MKILVLSLLRLGDIIQQVPLLKGLREKHPNAEIHLLANRQFANVEKLLEGLVDKYVYFDREALQKGLGETSYNILWSYQQVEELIGKLNSEEYSVAINLTHNKLSAYLLGAVQISDKRGLYQDAGRFKGLNNRWIRYFNDRFAGNEKSVFHYVELLGKAFDIPLKLGAADAPAAKKKSKLVLFQCLTSDTKKNWGLEQFRQLKKIIEMSLVDYEVMILGAGFEREQLLSVFTEKDLLICELSEARRHLQNAALLVTGDTSIKHLAAQVGTPIVELVLGSSDAVKTGAYAANSVVIDNLAPCAPCSHSQACSQTIHLCAESISVEKVFDAVWDQLSGEKRKVSQVLFDLERAAWSLYLDKNNQNVEPFYREAIQELCDKATVDKITSALPKWNERNDLYNNWLKKIESALPGRETLEHQKSFQSSDVAELVLCAQDILKSRKDESGIFQVFVESLLSRFQQPVQIYDKIQAALNEIIEIMEIRETLSRHLHAVSKEGAYYAKGIGHLSITGFEEAGRSIPRSVEDAEL